MHTCKPFSQFHRCYLMPLCLATVLGSLKYLSCQELVLTMIMKEFVWDFLSTGWQAGWHIVICHRTPDLSARETISIKNSAWNYFAGEQTVLPSMHTSFCVSVSSVVFFPSSFFLFNFGCERYLMYQKQFVQTLFYQLKACTPCWGPLI